MSTLLPQLQNLLHLHTSVNIFFNLNASKAPAASPTAPGEMLDEVKESIMNAYEIKTGMSRARISHLMDAESWFNAKKAVELGFADGVLHEGESTEDSVRDTESEGASPYCHR